MPTADSIAGMGGAPLDLQVYVSGDYTYYCQAIPGTWSALTDSNFRVFRLYKPGGVLSTVRYATNGVNSDGRTIGGTQFELAATDLATVAAYTYL